MYSVLLFSRGRTTMKADLLFRKSKARLFCVFAFGIVVGFTASSLLVAYQAVDKQLFSIASRANNKSQAYEETNNCPTQKTASLKIQLNIDDLNSTIPITRELLRQSDKLRARRLADEVRVLCWVMTKRENHKIKAFHVKATWGRHCNKLIFISDQEDTALPSVALEGVGTGRDGLWSKTVAAFKYVEQNFIDDYDWVMKADDDTYVFVENLRSMLLPYSSGDPIYFGYRFKPFAPQGYMSGGAGYVLSKEALNRFVHQALNGSTYLCPAATNVGAEDVNMALCLHSVGVRPGDSRDFQGRNRFFPFDIERHIDVYQEPKNWWYWDFIYWPIEQGLECCSDEPISFHYLTPSNMYMMEYLAYHVSPIPVMHLEIALAQTETPPTSIDNEQNKKAN